MSAGAVHAPSLERVATWAPMPLTREEETTDATELSDSSGVHASSASASSNAEETEESSNGGIASSTSETAESSTFDWTESHTPETLAPTETPSPTVAAAATPKPAASVATNATTKSGGGSSTTIGISLALVAVILILCVVYILYRRRQNRRNIRNKFFNPDLNTPTISIELPPPPPSSHLSGSQLNQSRLSVFSGTRSGGDSLFNTAAPVVSPHGRVHQNGRAVLGASTGAPFRPDQSMTYRLVDPSPSHSTPPKDAAAPTPNPAYTTFALTAASVGQAASPAHRSYQPDYDHPHMTDYGSPHHRKTSNAQRKISTATNVTTTSSASFSSETSSPMSIGTMTSSAMSVRTSGASETSTLNGLHDSMSEDVYRYGDGLGRERAASRGRGVSSASASTTASARGPSTVLEIDELMPAPVPVLPKTPTSAKTISFAAMRGTRAPPPPPPPPPPPFSQLLPEVEPFDPLLMTSVKVHKLRASEDDSGHGVVVASAFGDSSSSAPFSASHLLSSHNGRIFETPTDEGIQRLSDVSSVYSDSSSVRAGSLIELKQVTGLVENVDGMANEIEI